MQATYQYLKTAQMEEVPFAQGVKYVYCYNFPGEWGDLHHLKSSGVYQLLPLG